ncbi:MAG: hypothetical protein V4714_22085 [Bacteroidota bacterium]
MLQIKYTPAFQHRLEDIFAESDYILRYEKGNFKSGFCVLKETKVVIVNKYYPMEGKINCLIDILREIPIKTNGFSEKNQKLYEQLTVNNEQ